MNYEETFASIVKMTTIRTLIIVASVRQWCCYPIFDPCFDKFSEKTKNSKKTMKTQKMHF
jgi:hypothetical protein